MSDGATSTPDKDRGVSVATEFAIAGLSVQWSDQYDNPGSFQVGVDVEIPWEDLRYRLIEVDTGSRSGLSREQELVAPPRRPRVKHTARILYTEHESGFVRFVQIGSDSDYPRGGGAGTYRMEDGSEMKISSGWHVSEAVVNLHGDLPQITDVSVNTPKYDSVNMSGFWRVDTLLERLDLLPHVVLEYDGNGTYSPQLRGHPTKQEWRNMERARIEAANRALFLEHGVDPDNYRIVPEKVYTDPRYVHWDKDQVPYSSLSERETISVVPGDQWVMHCHNCGEKVSGRHSHSYRLYKKGLGTRDAALKQFHHHTRHYHFCRHALKEAIR